MKKLVSLIGVIAILLTISVSVFAGDIISPLMEDDAQIYFGEVKKLTDNTVTIIQKKNVKGEFKQDNEYEYERKDFTTREELEIGKIYLCTVFNTSNNFMIWEVTSIDTKTLEVLGDHTFAGEIQQYLNEGIFERAEQERSTLGNQISFAEFLYAKPLSDSNVAKITLRYQDELHEVDKDEFFRIAQEIMITNVKNDTIYETSKEGAYKTVLYVELLDANEQVVSLGAVSRFGEVDRYGLGMSRLMAKDYEMKTDDLSKLYSLFPDDVQKNIVAPEGLATDDPLEIPAVPKKTYTVWIIGGVAVIFVIAFAIGYGIRKRMQK